MANIFGNGRCFGLALLIVACAVYAQNNGGAKPDVQIDFSRDPCGNPMMESMGWVRIEGTVSKIVDGDTILLVSDDDHRIVRVHLAGIALERHAPSTDKAIALLRKTFLNQGVDVLVNPHRLGSGKSPGKVVGVMYLRQGVPSDAALSLVSEGLARFNTPRPYTMSNYTACRYRLAEAEAKSKRLGLWQ